MRVGLPLGKIPPPSRRFRALGIFVDLRPLPMASAVIQVCERRIEAILLTLELIAAKLRLPSGAASSLVGRLMFACLPSQVSLGSRCYVPSAGGPTKIART